MAAIRSKNVKFSRAWLYLITTRWRRTEERWRSSAVVVGGGWSIRTPHHLPPGKFPRPYRMHRLLSPSVSLKAVAKQKLLIPAGNRTSVPQPSVRWSIPEAVTKTSECFTIWFQARSQNCEKPLLASSCQSVRPHGTTRFPLDGFWRNLILEFFLENL
jgi:hypothetical protein